MPLTSTDLIAAQAVEESSAGSLPELFLENTKFHPHHVGSWLHRTRSFLDDPERAAVLERGVKSYRSHSRIALPAPDRETKGEGNVEGDATARGLGELSDLLRGVQRVIGECPGRPYEIYLAVRRWPPLAAGLYHFHGRDSCLEVLAERGDPRSLFPLPVDRDVAVDGSSTKPQEEAPLLVFVTAVPLRLSWVQGDRGARSLLVGAGRVLQALCHGARGSGRAAKVIEPFFDDAAHRFLGVDGVDELVVGVVRMEDEPKRDPAKGLRLAPGSWVLTSEDGVHVLNRRGSFDLPGRDLARLHRRLEPHLRGSWSRAELLAAVGAGHASAVEAYLDGLERVGALVEVPKEDSVVEPADVSQPRPRVTLLSPREAGDWLCDLDQRTAGPGREVGLVVDPEDAPAGDALDAVGDAVGDWLGTLLASQATAGSSSSSSEEVSLYRLDRLRGTLRRSVTVAPGRGDGLRSLPRQLELVRHGQGDQLPLVVLEASHPFFEGRWVAYGWDFEEVRDQLVRRFLAQRLGVVETALVAGSRPEVEAALLHRAAEVRGAEVPRTPSAAFPTVDLLDCREDHPRIRALQRILRLRRERFPVRLGETSEGVFLMWRTETAVDRPRASLTREHLVARALLEEIWRRFYPDGEVTATMVSSPRTFVPDRRLRRLVRRARRRMDSAGGGTATGRRVTFWDIPLWVAGEDP